MDKSGSGDGVSRSGAPGGADDAAEADAADPEVTAIARKLNDTGDTLGAIRALEQLIIERTGAIPIIVPASDGATPAPPSPATEPPLEGEPTRATEPPRTAAPAEPAHPDEPDEPDEPDGPDEPDEPDEPDDPEVDWAIPVAPRFDDEPGFSPWIDPDEIAAAHDEAPAPSYSDVSTQVFAVFSADRDEPKPEPQAPAQEPELSAPPLAAPATSLDVPPPVQVDDYDDDVVDDAPAASLEGLVPLASVEPRLAMPAAAESASARKPEPRRAGTPDAPDAPAAPLKRRRFRFFGRH